ncbi:MAG TPA: restriction endonuclease [Candidatus Micrarchaeaceae archaeon]|nr:restriction endonuclease [Candidatus Micrarchaeaceae archaeon]
MFRRGRRFEATTSALGYGEHPTWSNGQGVEPERAPVAPKATLLRYDSPPWLIDQELRKHHRERSHAASPLRGVSTQEVLAALVDAFSPAELDWDLVGVEFVQAHPEPVGPVDSPVELLAGAPWALDGESVQQAPGLVVPSGPAVHLPGKRGGQSPFNSRRPARWGREHDQIVAAVRELAWDGYFALVGDIFRREGYEVFGGEGPDGDVIDMEAVRGAERLLVNCQLRGLEQIGVEPLSEMSVVAQRNDAGVAIVSDGNFAPEAWSYADEQGIAIIDKEILTGLVLELTLGNAFSTNLRAKARRLLTLLQPASRKLGATTNIQ